MDFYRTFHTVTFLLILVGLGSTLLMEFLPLYAQIIAAAFATICFVLRLKGHNPTIPKGVKNILSVTVILFLIADIYFFTSPLLQASIKFLILIEVLKFFDLQRNRDYFQLYTIIFLQVISTTARTSSIAFLPALILFTVLIIWAMILFHLKREGEKHLTGTDYTPVNFRPAIGSEKMERVPHGVITPTFLLTTAFISILSLLTTLFIFFLTPRFGVGMLHRGFAEGVRLSGFTETIDLGEIGKVKLDPAVVMRVELPEVKNPLKLPLYWRGRAFEHFDGFRWSQKNFKRSPLKKNRDGLFIIDDPIGYKRYASGVLTRDDKFSGKGWKGQKKKPEGIKQKITLEPLLTEVVFAASYGSVLDGDLFWPSRDEMGTLYLPRSSFKSLDYTVYSTLSPSNDQKLLHRNKYLQLYDSGGKMKDLADSITGGASTDEEKALAVYDYLIKNYRYNLNSPWKGEGNPLETFLLDVKEGYCEQFATSMSILLRHAGVPTRLVTGFQRGEWNKYGNYFLVRQKNAHAWVEVYLPSKGWTTFDPTPPVEIERSFIASPLLLFFDSFRRQWDRYIIQYSFGDQVSMMHSLKGRSVNVTERLKEVSVSVVRRIKGLASPNPVAIGIIILLMPTVFFFVSLFKKRIWMERVSGEELVKRGLDFYVKMLWILEKKGIKKRKDVTAGEFARQTVSTHGEDLHGVFEITDCYHRVRFGGAGMDRKEQQYIKEILNQLEKKRLKRG
jgi:hypothetical protein